MKKERKVNMILAIVLWLICIAMFLPMVFVIINSFKTFGQVVMEPLHCRRSGILIILRKL